MFRGIPIIDTEQLLSFIPADQDFQLLNMNSSDSEDCFVVPIPFQVLSTFYSLFAKHLV